MQRWTFEILDLWCGLAELFLFLVNVTLWSFVHTPNDANLPHSEPVENKVDDLADVKAFIKQLPQ